MSRHVSILLDTIVRGLIEPLLAPSSASTQGYLVDCTLGGGGHTGALLEALREAGLHDRFHVVSIDRDETAIERARSRFAAELKAGQLRLIGGDFASAVESLRASAEKDARPCVGLMADLGISSDQIDEGARGLSFLRDGPLDMRMDQSTGMTARDWLAQARESEIADVIFEYGEERFSRRVARAVVQARESAPIPDSTLWLADLVRRAYPGPQRHTSRIHPATRTFQAVRIHVNDELEQLDRLLVAASELVAIGGRLAFLSFHSLEDRRVKVKFKGAEAFRPLTKKPIEPSDDEIAENPRARSAKLRLIERVA